MLATHKTHASKQNSQTVLSAVSHIFLLVLFHSYYWCDIRFFFLAKKLFKYRLRNVQFMIYLLTAIGLSPGGSGYFTCKQNMKLVITRFKSGGLHEKHVVATWNVGNRLSICL